jgi:hypothetical protein
MSIETVVNPKQRAADSARSVEAHLTFAERTQEKPCAYVGEPPEGVPRTRGEYRSRAVRVEDARPIAEHLSLDVEDVALVRHVTAVRDFWDQAQTLALGHPETAIAFFD